jgi:hypothetical protein
LRLDEYTGKNEIITVADSSTNEEDGLIREESRMQSDSVVGNHKTRTTVSFVRQM